MKCRSCNLVIETVWLYENLDHLCIACKFVELEARIRQLERERRGRMSIQRFGTVRWFTCPKELREIAAKMEAMWPDSLPGDDLTVRVRWDGDMKLEILMDQNEMEKGR